MYAKPPSELNLDPVTCQVGFAAVLCIMQTTIAAEMRDHDSWRGSQQSPAGPWTGPMRCGRDEGPDPAEVCTSQSTGDQGGMEETRRLSRLGSGLRSCGETLIGIRGRWAEHGLALCRRPSWALRHACDDRQITQPPRLPERASTLGGEQVKSNPGKVEKKSVRSWMPLNGPPIWELQSGQEPKAGPAESCRWTPLPMLQRGRERRGRDGQETQCSALRHWEVLQRACRARVRDAVETGTPLHGTGKIDWHTG